MKHFVCGVCGAVTRNEFRQKGYNDAHLKKKAR